MNKLFEYLIPTIGVAAIIAAIGGYMYLTAVPAFDKEYQQVLADQQHLRDNQQKYADCYYTAKSNPEFITATVVNRFYNEGVHKDELANLEKQFLAKYDKECMPVITTYENRFRQYQADQERLDRAKLTKIDKLMGKTPVVEKQRSDSFSLYEKYDPKSLQYPVSTQGKMLYSAEQFADFLNKNLQ